MQIRQTNKQDYDELCKWWKWHRFPIPPIEILDNLKYGLMVNNGTENICAGFLYFTNAKGFGLLEYVVSTNKIKDRQLRKVALELLLNGLKKVAKQNGIKILFSSLRSESLIKTYKNCGFVVGSKNTTELICKL